MPCQHLRSGVKYRCLDHHEFSLIEKEYICKYILNHGMQSKSAKEFRLKEICKRYSLYINVLDEWIRSYEFGDETVLDEIGANTILRLFNYSSDQGDVESNIINNQNLELIIQQLNLTQNRNLSRIRRPKMKSVRTATLLKFTKN